MKKTKLAILLVMVLVLALQGAGLMPAAAEDAANAASVEDLTVDYIFDGLGEALHYGIVAETYKQLNHAETSVFVDKLIKNHSDPFLNTLTTYMYGQAYPLYATVSAPEGETLLNMQFALFTVNGDAYTMVEDTLYTVAEDTNVTTVGWKLPEDSPYLYKNLYIRQVEEKADGSYDVVTEGAENSAELTVHYGPYVSSAAPSSSYIGEVVSNQWSNSINFYNTKEHNPPITFGPGNRLVVWQIDYDNYIPGWGYAGEWVDVSGTNATANTPDVYLEYKNENGQIRYAKFDGVQYEVKNGKGVFYANTDGGKLYLDINFTEETGKAAALLQQASAFSEAIGNMTGGTIIHDESKGSYGSYDPSILGNSTVTGPEDENGNVVSLYNVEIGSDWDFDEWDLQESIGQQKLLIAPNEYVVFNIVCPAPTGEVIMHPNAENMYIPAAGKQEQTMWGEEDSGASDRVLFNFIYKAEDGTYKPFTGTVRPSNTHGGTLLVPNGSVENDRNPHNGAMIAKYVENNGKEIHQRTMTSPAQTSWVNMLGDTVVTTGSIKVIKKNGSTQELLDDVEFTVYTDAACTKKLEQDGLTNPAKTGKPHDTNHGFVLFEGLNPGTYYVKETKSKPGYVVNDMVYTIVVKAGVTSLVGTKGYVENFKGKGTLELVKAEEGNISVKLAGAEFALYHCKGKDFKENEATLLGVYTTDNNGKIQLRLDASPDYWIEEVKAPFGYELGITEPKKVEIKKDQTTVVESAAGTGLVTNAKKPQADLKVTKVDADDETIKLQNAEFKVYLDEACKDEVGTFTTDQNGEGSITLPVGTYWVKETKAPSNYNITFEKQRVEIVEGETALLGTNGVVTNELRTGKIYLWKVEQGWKQNEYGQWQQGVVAFLENAEFTVYQYVNNVLTEVTTMLTDKNGYAELELPVGYYVVKETRAPIGYAIGDTNEKQVQVQENTSTLVWGSLWVEGEDAKYNGAFTNSKAETGNIELFKGYKEANGSTTPLYDAEFGIYYDEACTQLISKHKTADFYKGGEKQLGGFNVPGFTVGETYYLKELTPPVGYKALPEDAVLSVKIESTGNNRVYYNGQSVVYNEKAADSVSATLGLSKTLKAVGDNVSVSGEHTFDFTMTLAAESAKTTGYTIVDGAESVKFSTAETQDVTDAFKVSFTETGEYTFDVKETKGSETDYIVYDNTTHKVVFTVTEDADGKLVVNSSVAGGKVSFTNKYSMVYISGSKLWNNDAADTSLRLKVDEFSKKYLKLYTVDNYGADVKPSDYELTEVTVLINPQDDHTSPQLSVSMDEESGTFYWNYNNLPAFDENGKELWYVIKELTVAGYQTFYVNPYDSYSYNPTEKDALYPRPNVTGFQIYNVLSKDTLTIEKTVSYEGDAPAEKTFQFTITPDDDTKAAGGYTIVDKDSNPDDGLYTVTMDYATGKTATLAVDILFDTFRYDENVPTTSEDKDKGTESKTFTFTVAEVAGSESGWEYDDTTTKVTYTVTRTQANVGSDDQQAVTVTVDETSKGKASFTNRYEKVTYQQGSFYIYKSIAAESGTGTANSAFDFIIEPNTTEGYTLLMYPQEDQEKKTQLTPAKDGKFTARLSKGNSSLYMLFDVIFTEAGTYTFEVYEVIPTPYPKNWEYDDHHMTVTFDVAANGTVTTTTKHADPTKTGDPSHFYNDLYATTELNITKYWEDDNNAAGMRPTDMQKWAEDNLTLRYAVYPVGTNGLPDYSYEFTEKDWTVYETVTPVVTSDYVNTWDVAYNNLPSYIDGKKVTWSVVEADIPGYTKVYDWEPDQKWGATISITNTMTTLTVYKAWEYGTNSVTDVPDVSVYLQLWRKTSNDTDYTLVTGVTPVYDKEAATYTWYGLDKTDTAGREYHYIVKETQYPGYLTQYEDEKDYADADEFITNKYFEGFVELYGYKYLDGQPSEMVFIFELVDEDGNVVDTEGNQTYDNPSSSLEKGGFRFQINYSGADLGKTYIYTIRERNDGYTDIDYDETEYKVKVVIDNAGNITKSLLVDGGYVEYDSDEVVFNNKTKTETTASVSIQKVWYNKDGEILEDMKPDISQMLELYILHKDGSLELVKDANGEPLRPVADLSGDYATFVWEGLTPLTNETDKYAVKENVAALRTEYPGYMPLYVSDRPENEDWANYTIKGYETIAENDSGTVTNHMYADRHVDVAFKYVDGKNATKAEEFTFVLKNTVTGETQTLKNGTPFRNLVTGEMISLDYAIPFQITYGANDLPVSDSKSYYYELYEVDPGDGKYIYDDAVYKFCVTIDAAGNMFVTYWDEAKQAYTKELSPDYRFYNKTLTSVSVTKEWVGGQYAGSTEPVTLTLYADGVAQAAQPTQTGNTYTWTKLPLCNDKGELIAYTVEETEVPDGYTVTYLNEVGEDAGEQVATDAAFDGGKIVNTYKEEEVYEAKGSIVLEGTKVLNGRKLTDGEFSFELYRVDGETETFIEKVANKDRKIIFSEIKYTEKDAGKTYTYKVYEVKGNLAGVTYVEKPVTVKVTVTDNGDGTMKAVKTADSEAISFVNTYKAEGEVTFKGTKTLLGREFQKGDAFTFELLDEAGTVIDTVTINPESGAKADFAFKTIKYDLADVGETYTYTYRVKEKAGSDEGMTYDDTIHTVTVTVKDAGNGTLVATASPAADKLSFTNTYTAKGAVIFTGTKTMNGKALAGDDFTFVLTDAEGTVLETVTNDKDGVIAFSAIQYSLADAGKTFTYKVYEVNDKQTAVTYDDTVYTVTVKVDDDGDGDLKTTVSDNAKHLNFTNSYAAKAVLTMNAYKTVNGYKPTVNQVYDFVLLCDDGTEMTAQNKDETISFGNLTFDENDIGKTFIYTIKETTQANELLDVDDAIYEVAVTVSDGGDGNLKLDTVILKDGKRATGVVFANTATATLAISKTVKGPGPDKAFDLKVTFIDVDGKELEGVYDYSGDVSGTITSGGVISLKDGQSVTIVGLPEGATYTVEENAGPAYTVTVNGKPIAKAEGTLVGHGKLEFINTVEVTTFSVTKVWEGADLGAITLTLYADGKQMTPQPEVTREGDKYTYYNLPKYNEEGEEIVYSAKERGIEGYIRIYENVEPYQNVANFVHDGGTIINREVEEEVHELSFKIRKTWTGMEANEEIPAITLTLYCNGEKVDVPTPKPDGEGWYRYYDLPKTVNGKIAVYTVIEESIPGFTVTYKTASGEIVEEGVNGGEIINAKIPQTSDNATLGLWLALMGASAALLTMLQRRRKA